MNRAELIELIGAEIGNAWHAQDWEENIADALLVAISKHCGYLMDAVIQEREAERQFNAWHEFFVSNGLRHDHYLVRELVGAVTAYRSECTKRRRAVVDLEMGR